MTFESEAIRDLFHTALSTERQVEFVDQDQELMENGQELHVLSVDTGSGKILVRIAE